jgi:hypothetical protein
MDKGGVPGKALTSATIIYYLRILLIPQNKTPNPAKNTPTPIGQSRTTPAQYP